MLNCGLTCGAAGSNRLALASDFAAEKTGEPDSGDAGGKFVGAALTGAGESGLGLAAEIAGVGEDSGAATRSEGNRMPQKPTTGSVNSSSTYPLMLR